MDYTENGPIPNGCSTGLVPRDYAAVPVGSMSFAPEFPASELIDPSEWGDRLNENRKNRSGLLDLREDNYDTLKSLDQDGLSLCWAFSSTKAVMYCRALMGETPLVLSAWYVAGQIKRWADQGGWGGSSLAFIVQHGIPTIDKCPRYSPSAVTSDAQSNALLHRVTEWWDGSDDPTVAQQQMVSSLLRRVPCVADLNDMAHSMVAIDIASLNPLKIIFDNSWATNGDPKGLYIGSGPRARPNGLVIPRFTMPSGG